MIIDTAKVGSLSERKIGIYIISRDGEIVEFNGVTNGRSCKLYDCSGMRIRPDGFIRFKFCIACVNRKTEEAKNTICIRDGKESCTINFFAENIIMPMRDHVVRQFGQIIEMYENSDNEVLRHLNRNKKNSICRPLKDVQGKE